MAERHGRRRGRCRTVNFFAQKTLAPRGFDWVFDPMTGENVKLRTDAPHHPRRMRATTETAHTAKTLLNHGKSVLVVGYLVLELHLRATGECSR